MSAPSEDCESFAWIMKESLSSSGPRSGDVDEELEEEELDLRSRCRERDMIAAKVWCGKFCRDVVEEWEMCSNAVGEWRVVVEAGWSQQHSPYGDRGDAAGGKEWLVYVISGRCDVL